MFWADSMGSKYIYSKLDEWSKTYGDFFKPCAFLAERGSKGAPLVSISFSSSFSFWLVSFSFVHLSMEQVSFW